MRAAEHLPQILRRWRLLALCAGADLVEAGLTAAFAPHALSLAPQASAIASFGVFHDLRWVSVYSDSWWSATAELAAMVVVRALLIALAVRWAWPEAGPGRPPLGRLWVRGAATSVFIALLLAPSAGVVFASAVVPVSWLFIAGVPAALFISIVVQPVGVRKGWWRHPLPLRAAGWALLSFVVASLAGAAVSAAAGRPVLAVLAAGLAGVFNAWAWDGTVRAVVLPRRPSAVRPVVPVALAILAGGVVGGALAGFAGARHAMLGASPEGRGQGHQPGSRPLLVLDGYGSAWDGIADHPIPGRWDERHFSYKGTTRGGRPLPYVGEDTVKPLPELVRLLAAQVERLARRDRQPVDLVAESEGAIIAEAYLHATPGAPVGEVVLLSPLLWAGGVSYPVAGAGGWGQAGAWEMAVLGDAFQSSAPINLSPDNPFLRSIVDEAPLLRQLTSCPVGGVRQVGILSLADAVGVPPHLHPAFPTVVLPYFHGGMLQRRPVDSLVARLLDGQPPREDQVMSVLASAVSWAASSWQVPDLPDSYLTRPAGAALVPSGCTGIDADLFRLVWGSQL